MKVFYAIISLLFFAGCAVNKKPQITGEDRGSGIVEVSYKHADFEKAVVNWKQTNSEVDAKCKAWGYKGARQQGGISEVCTIRSQLDPGCIEVTAVATYQCDKTPTEYYLSEEDTKALSKPMAQIPANNDLVAGGYTNMNQAQLECGVNINCRDHADVISKLSQAQAILESSNSRGAQAMKNVCLQSIFSLEKLPNSLRNNENLYSSYLHACNEGLKQMQWQ